MVTTTNTLSFQKIGMPKKVQGTGTVTTKQTMTGADKSYVNTARIGQACNLIAQQWLAAGSHPQDNEARFIEEVYAMDQLLDRAQQSVSKRIIESRTRDVV